MQRYRLPTKKAAVPVPSIAQASVRVIVAGMMGQGMMQRCSMMGGQAMSGHQGMTGGGMNHDMMGAGTSSEAWTWR